MDTLASGPVLNGPSFLDAAQALAPIVRAQRDHFDQERQLPASLVEAIREAGLFGLWLPRSLGGAELPPLDFLEIIDALSRQDGSVGWCTVIPAGYGRLAGAMEPQAASTVFQAGRGILVGTLNPTGKAMPVDGGWRVTGDLIHCVLRPGVRAVHGLARAGWLSDRQCRAGGGRDSAVCTLAPRSVTGRVLRVGVC